MKLLAPKHVLMGSAIFFSKSALKKYYVVIGLKLLSIIVDEMFYPGKQKVNIGKLCKTREVNIMTLYNAAFHLRIQQLIIALSLVLYILVRDIFT